MRPESFWLLMITVLRVLVALPFVQILALIARMPYRLVRGGMLVAPKVPCIPIPSGPAAQTVCSCGSSSSLDWFCLPWSCQWSDIRRPEPITNDQKVAEIDHMLA